MDHVIIASIPWRHIMILIIVSLIDGGRLHHVLTLPVMCAHGWMNDDCNLESDNRHHDTIPCSWLMQSADYGAGRIGALWCHHPWRVRDDAIYIPMIILIYIQWMIPSTSDGINGQWSVIPSHGTYNLYIMDDVIPYGSNGTNDWLRRYNLCATKSTWIIHNCQSVMIAQSTCSWINLCIVDDGKVIDTLWSYDPCIEDWHHLWVIPSSRCHRLASHEPLML